MLNIMSSELDKLNNCGSYILVNIYFIYLEEFYLGDVFDIVKVIFIRMSPRDLLLS